jgi:hypothetical protein
MNDFCEYCTAGNRQEIYECKDRNCPFYRERRYNMEWQTDKIERAKSDTTI